MRQRNAKVTPIHREKSDHVPYFQQLQMQFAQHIRNPEQAYAPENEKPIEARRLKAYEDLFFNNLHEFFSQLFPVCKLVLGKTRWAEVIREYMRKHRAETPLFHELGEEFVIFIEEEFEPQDSDPEFLLELAHYEWVELAVMVSQGDVYENDPHEWVDLNANYEMSALALPVAYEWPVHQISEDYQPTEKPEQPTTILVYRAVDGSDSESVAFMELTPLLYQWLMVIDSCDSAMKALEEVTQSLSIDQEALHSFAKQTLQKLLALGVIHRL